MELAQNLPMCYNASAMHIHSCLGLAPSALLVKTKFIPCTFTTVGRMAELNTLTRVRLLSFFHKDFRA